MLLGKAEAWRTSESEHETIMSASGPYDVVEATIRLGRTFHKGG